MKGNKVLVNKEFRDEFVAKANDIIENKLDERKTTINTIDDIDGTIKKYKQELKMNNKKYRLDRSTSRKVLRMKLKEAKRAFRKAQKQALREYREELRNFYKPVEIEKDNIENAKGEKYTYDLRLDEINEEIMNLQKFKAYIEMQYTSQKRKFIDTKELPKILK